MGLAWHTEFRLVHQNDAEEDDSKHETIYDPPMASDTETMKTQRHYTKNYVKIRQLHSTIICNDTYGAHEDNNERSHTIHGDSFQDEITPHLEGYYATRPVSLSPVESIGSHTIGRGGPSNPVLLQEDFGEQMLSRGELPNYKPFVFRLWYLCTLLVFLASILALIGLAMHVLPDGTQAAVPVAVIENGTEMRVREEPGAYSGRVNVGQWHSEAPQVLRERQQGTGTLTTSTQSSDLDHMSIGDNHQGQSSSNFVNQLIVSTTDVEKDALKPTWTSVGSTSTSIQTISAIGDSSLHPKSQIMTSSEVSSSLPPSLPINGLVTCTVTRKVIHIGNGRTHWVPTQTVTVQIYTRTKKTTSGNGGSSDIPAPVITAPPLPSSSECDVIVITTKTVRKPGHGGFVFAGRNTVTITVPGGNEDEEEDSHGGVGGADEDDEENEDDPPASDHTSTCNLRTVTVTDRVNAVAATKTVTIDITILPRALPTKEKPMATPPPEKAIVRPRACIGGGTMTVTELVAMPQTLTITVWRTFIKGGLTSSRVHPWVSSSSKRALEPPKIVTSIIRGGGKAITRESTISVNDAQDIRPTLPSSQITTAIRITTTDDRGKAIVTLLTGVYDANQFDNTLFQTTWTDHDGHTVVGTGTKVINLGHGTKSEVDLARPRILTLATTLRDSKGRPTLTTSMIALASLTETTLTNSLGLPTKTEAHYVLNNPQTTVISDSNGEPSSTATYYLITSSTTLTDENGQPTSTSTVVYTKTISTMTKPGETGKAGNGEITIVPASFPNPAPTASGSAAPQPTETSNIILQVYSITEIQYFAGLILPTLIATALTIPIRILDHVAKVYHPFHVLATTAGGAKASHSVYWKPTSIWVIMTRFQTLLQGNALLSITGALVAISSILVPVSAETIRIVLHGDECRMGQGDADNCAITVGLFLLPAWIAIAILILLAILTILVILVLRHHQTGIFHTPWSLSELASLSSNYDIQTLLNEMSHVRGRVKDMDIMQILGTQTYALGYWQQGIAVKYGVVPLEMTTFPKSRDKSVSIVDPQARTRRHKMMPFFVLTLWGRIAILLVLCGILAIILTYNMTSRETVLGQFLSGETTVVRILVTSVGMLITLLWSLYFHCLAFINPYRKAYTDKKSVNQVNAKLSTNVFSGLIRSLRPSSRDLYLAAMAFTAILADFLPALISNVPYKVIQTWLAHTVCTWITVSILVVMLVLVATSFFIHWPHMPIDPSTIIGAMYYVSQLDDETMSLLAPNL